MADRIKYPLPGAGTKLAIRSARQEIKNIRLELVIASHLHFNPAYLQSHEDQNWLRHR